MLKTIVSFFTVIGVFFIILWIAMAWSYESAGEKAEKICSLATVGMKYIDFKDAVSKAGVTERKPLEESIENGGSRYTFMFMHMMFSANSCDIYVKDNIIIKKEVIMDAG